MSSWPKLVIFDLDFTLWDAGGLWCDCTSPPYIINDGRVLDSAGRHIKLYDDVIEILDWLQEKNIDIGIASRTRKPSWAVELLQLLQVNDRFAFQEIYPSSKVKHFKQLQKDSGIPYQDMLFFDDEYPNIEEVIHLGVQSVWVRHGVHWQCFREAIK